MIEKQDITIKINKAIRDLEDINNKIRDTKRRAREQVIWDLK